MSNCGDYELTTCTGTILKAAIRNWQGWCYLLWCYTEGSPQVLAGLVLYLLWCYTEGSPQVLAGLVLYLLWCYTEGSPQVLARLVLPALVLYWRRPSGTGTAGATCSGAILKAAFRYWHGWCYLLRCYTEGSPQVLARLVLPALVLYWRRPSGTGTAGLLGVGKPHL
jgi:hypothetical protein